MSIYDESGECERIECPICHVDADESCDHLLAFVDVTFCEEPCGPVGDHLSAFEKIISDAFAEKLTAGKDVTWNNFLIESFWDSVQEEGVSDPGNLTLPAPAFYSLVFDFLSAAGGWEHPGELIAGSGGRCASAVRLMYAENPQKVIEQALELLRTELADSKPKPRRRRKK